MRVFTSLQRQRAMTNKRLFQPATKKFHKHLLSLFQYIKSLPQRTIKKYGKCSQISINPFHLLDNENIKKKKKKAAFDSRDSPPKTNQPSSKPIAFTTLYHHHAYLQKNQRAFQLRPPPSQTPIKTSLHSFLG
jgi:hypothetical protein